MARRRILIKYNDTFTRVIDWDDSDGDAIDLTGYTVLANVTVGPVSFDLTEGDGLTVDAPNGRITLELSDDQTASFLEHFGTWELVTISPSGKPKTLVEGLVFVYGIPEDVYGS